MRPCLPLLVLLALSSCDCGVEVLTAVPGRVAGVLCSEDTGLPVPGVALALTDDAGNAISTGQTDASGNFLIDRVPAGPAVLVVSDGERSIELVVSSDSTTSVKDSACRDVPPGPGFGDIIGTICNRHTGALVQAATVTVVLPDDQTQQTTTDDAGRFQLWNVPTGLRVVIVSGEGFQRSWAVDVLEGTFVEIPSGGDCRLPEATEGMLAGVFCDPATGGLLSGATVTVTDSDERVHSELTDDEGAFLLGPMTPGPAQVHVEKGDFLFDVTAVIVAGDQVQVTNGGGCVVEQCQETVLNSENDGRMELLLVVDRSGSMASGAPGYSGTRWEGVAAALQNVTAQLQARVAFGLALFPALGSPDCGTATLSVEPAFDNAPALATLLGDFYTEPLGATPTAAALEAVLDWHATHPTDLPRAVLLATDGGPNCNEGLDPDSCRCSSGSDDNACQQSFDPRLCLDDVAAVTAVQGLRALGLDTYVIGIPGVENFADVLDRMAEAGGTDNYYVARDSGVLEAAVGDIGRRAGGCSLDIAEDLTTAARLDVTIDGTAIPRDPLRSDGFDVIDAHHLELYGEACEAWLTAGSLSLGLCTIPRSVP